jgi:COMPASS component SWD1
VTVWAQQQVENWSAFAPDFKELDENVDYEERESEFDLEDEDKSVQMDEEEKADIVDEIEVDKNVPIPAFCSSDEEEEDKSALLYLPIAQKSRTPRTIGYPELIPHPQTSHLIKEKGVAAIMTHLRKMQVLRKRNPRL